MYTRMPLFLKNYHFVRESILCINRVNFRKLSFESSLRHLFLDLRASALYAPFVSMNPELFVLFVGQGVALDPYLTAWFQLRAFITSIHTSATEPICAASLFKSDALYRVESWVCSTKEDTSQAEASDATDASLGVMLGANWPRFYPKPGTCISMCGCRLTNRRFRGVRRR